MTIETEYGYKIPELGDVDFFDSWNFNFERVDSHDHDGTNSSPIVLAGQTQDSENRLVTDVQIADWDQNTTDLSDHELDTGNPHSVTKSQVGLGSADDTADADKPVSTATQAALDASVSQHDDIDLTGIQPSQGVEWDGTKLIPTSLSVGLSLGETSFTAYQGDRGKIAFDYSQLPTTRGDILVNNAANTTARLPIGTVDQVLTSDGDDVSWQPPTIEGMPSGGLLAFAGSAVPNGWLPCDGVAVSRATYSNLFAALGTTWGVGDGATTFNLPDLGGRALKGAGTINDGQGGDTVALGAFQGDSTAKNGLSNATSTVSGISGTNAASGVTGVLGTNATSTVSGVTGSNATSTVSGVTGSNGTSTVSGITGANSTSSLSGTSGGESGHTHNFQRDAGQIVPMQTGGGGREMTGTLGTGDVTDPGSNHTHAISGTAAAQSWSQSGSGTAAGQSWSQSGTGTALGQSWSQSGTGTAAAQGWSQSGTAAAAAQGWSQNGTGTANSQTISGDTETRPKAYGVNYIIKT